jgi:hypothetical protein
MATSKTALLTTHKNEHIKVYIEYDGLDRQEYTYTAATDAADGAPCLRTQYVYDGTSGRVIKMKESEATWDSDWDV